MPKLHRTTLDLPRCPHCGVDTPHLQFHQPYQLGDYKGGTRYWCSYSCRRCAGLVIAEGTNWDQDVLRVFPNSSMEVSDDIPDRARTYLVQAMDSIKNLSVNNVYLARHFPKANGRSGEHVQSQV